MCGLVSLTPERRQRMGGGSWTKEGGSETLSTSCRSGECYRVPHLGRRRSSSRQTVFLYFSCSNRRLKLTGLNWFRRNASRVYFPTTSGRCPEVRHIRHRSAGSWINYACIRPIFVSVTTLPQRVLCVCNVPVFTVYCFLT